MDFSAAPITYILIGLNVVFSIIGFSNQTLLAKTIGWPYYEKRNKEYYRFITSGFLHADWMHLFFNMFTLYFFGTYVEYIFSAGGLGGGIMYLILYFGGMIVADIPSYIKHQNNENYRSLGASGAVSAVVFGTLIFSPWSQIALYGAIKVSMLIYAVLYVIYCIYMGKQNNDNVNHDAHLWGSVFGLAFTIAVVFLLRSDCIPYIMEDFKNVELFGTKETSATLIHLLTGR
jgi:membrane associated rhomboid family serine protease